MHGHVKSTMMYATSKPMIPGITDSTQAFVVVIVICLFIFSTAVLFFSLMRTKLPHVYAPRQLLLESKLLPTESSTRSLFSWILPAFNATEDDIFHIAGIDAVVYMRFIKLMLKFSIITMPLGIVVLLPLNVTGGNDIMPWMERISMSNVSAKSKKLWAHFLAIWTYSLVMFYLTYQEWEIYIKYRQMYLSKGLEKQYALLVQNLPKGMIDEQMLKMYLEKLFPCNIARVYIIEDLSHWDQLIQKHDNLVYCYERAQLYFEKKGERQLRRSTPCSPLEDALSFYENELQLLQAELEEEYASKKRKLNHAVVFFNCLQARTIALQTVWSGKPFVYDVGEAPEPVEMNWDNLMLPQWAHVLRRSIGFVLVVILILFWTVPTTVTSTVASLTSLAEKLPSVKIFLDSLSPGARGFVQGVIPVLLLNMFLLLLPIILRAIGRFQGLISQSKIAMMVFVNLFVFQTVNTFFVFIISGSLLDSLSRLIQKPTELPTLLAQSLPSQANFFVNYVALQTFASHSLELTRMVDLILITFRLKFLAKTARERLNAWRPTRVEYEVLYSKNLLIFLVGISFSILSPIIVPFVVLYFAFAYVVWSYQLLHVYIPEFENGGKFWPQVFHRIMVATIVFQLLMVGVLLLKKMWTASFFVLVLVTCSFGFWYFIHSKYHNIGKYLGLGDTRVVNSAMIRDVENAYVRNHKVPGLHEVSTDHMFNVSMALNNDTSKGKGIEEDQHAVIEEDTLLLERH